MLFDRKPNACVRCGFCCGVGKEKPCICSYGAFNDAKTKCRFLQEDDKELGTYKCLIYREIKEVERNSKLPMFDCGCSSSLFNEIRDKVIERLKANGRFSVHI